MDPEQPFDDEMAGRPPDALEPEEEASEGALAAAETFFEAVKAGDARRLWDIFGENAKLWVINIGQERGMGIDLASRLRQGIAGEDEEAEFLADLMAGIQRDLSGLDFSRMAFESKVEPEAPMQVRVHYLMQLGPQMGDLTPAIPAGSLILTLEDSGWRVERLIPRPGKEESTGPLT